jgi:sec-independent protein translocase protein TatC
LSEGRRTDLIGHLSELRARLIRVIVYVACGMAVAWALFDPLFDLVARPILLALKQLGGKLQLIELLEGLTVRMSIALVGGLTLAAPLIFYEVWSFIAPGLTSSERRAARPLVPVAGLLFLMGVGIAHVLSTRMVLWLLKMGPRSAEVELSVSRSVLTLVKFYFAFGLCFQLPIVIVLLAKIGIVDSGMLTRKWREAVVIILVMAAIATPTWDPITLAIASVPLIMLYVGTIGVVKLMERRERRARESEESSSG